jgi:hypothetical protein
MGEETVLIGCVAVKMSSSICYIPVERAVLMSAALYKR